VTIKVGFFFELDDQAFVSTLESLRRAEADPKEARILAYLGAGAACGVVPMLEEDLVEKPSTPIGVPELVTDGEYVWPTTLCYYVKKYHIALPDEFVRHMRANGWKVPQGIDGNAVKWEGETQIG